MAKWADYLISGIWQTESNNSKYISHVMLHVDLGETVGQGAKKDKDQVIKLIKDGARVVSIKWNYEKARWSIGAAVTYEVLNGVAYLRTIRDASVSDNLDNLIPFSSFSL